MISYPIQRLTVVLFTLIFVISASSNTNTNIKDITNEQGIIFLNDSNFKELVFERKKFSFVYFYSEGCIWCNRLNPEFEPLGELFNNTEVQIIKMDGASNLGVRKEYNLKSFPTVKLFDQKGREISTYHGDRTTDFMAAHITQKTNVKSNIPRSKVIDLTDAQFESLLQRNKGKNIVIAFFLSYMQEWNNLHHFYETLAKSHTDTVFVRVDGSLPTSANITYHFRIGNYPSLAFIPKEGNQKYNENQELEVVQVYSGKELDMEQVLRLIAGQTIGEWYTADSLEKRGEQKEVYEGHKYYNHGFNFNKILPKHKKQDPNQEDDDSYFMRHMEL